MKQDIKQESADMDPMYKGMKKDYNDDAFRSLRSPAAATGASGVASSSRVAVPATGSSGDAMNNMSSFRRSTPTSKSPMAGLAKGNVLTSPSARNISSANVSSSNSNNYLA